MASRAFENTVVSFNATNIGRVRSLRHDNICADVDVTGVDDTEHVYEPGKPNHSISLEVVGSTTLTPQTTGALTITWGDNTSANLGNHTLMGVASAGQLDGAIVRTLTFRKAP